MTNTTAYEVGLSYPPPEPTLVLQRPLVLVVDDHADMRLLLRIYLEQCGLHVREVEDGEAGVREAEEFRPDLILMDWGLPVLDGVTAMRVIRGRAYLDLIPVVILSGYDDPRYQKVAREAGCAEYLVKPFDLRRLDQVLECHLRH
jgi:DNA-binding response OmpR family regulator